MPRKSVPKRQTTRVAKDRRPDGTLVLRVDVPTFLDLDQTALALALVYQGQRMRMASNDVRYGLIEAVRNRLLDQPNPKADAESVEAYRQALIDRGAFPDPDAPPDDPHSVESFDPSKAHRMARIARYNKPDGTPIMRVDNPTLFDLEEASLALALVYAGQPVRVGLNLLINGLVEAARDRLLEQPAHRRSADPAAVQQYRLALTNSGVFPEPKEDA